MHSAVHCANHRPTSFPAGGMGVGLHLRVRHADFLWQFGKSVCVPLSGAGRCRHSTWPFDSEFMPSRAHQGKGMPVARVAAQDDARENKLVDLFNLTRPANRVRHGTDAILKIDDQELEFELKSVTRVRGGISTVRDLGPDHIRKWKNKHWIVAFYDGDQLSSCRYGSPDDMAPWIATIWDYIRLDFEMAQMAPNLITIDLMHQIIGQKDKYTLSDAKKIHKKQYTEGKYRDLMDIGNGYSPGRMLDIFRDRARYVMERGATLNNPHIPATYFSNWPEINENHAVQLRTLVKAWLAAMGPEWP